MTPTARSLKYLRDRGFIACKVEQILHMPGRPFPFKKDAFGFGDILAAQSGMSGIEGFGIYLIQVTSTGNVSKRCEKIKSDPKVAPFAIKWLQSSGNIHVHGWAKRGPRGKAKRWTLTKKTFSLVSTPTESHLLIV